MSKAVWDFADDQSNYLSGHRNREADSVFAEAIASQRFEDHTRTVSFGRMPRVDPAEGMYASAAHTCAQAGARSYQDARSRGEG